MKITYILSGIIVFLVFIIFVITGDSIEYERKRINMLKKEMGNEAAYNYLYLEKQKNIQDREQNHKEGTEIAKYTLPALMIGQGLAASGK